MRIEITHLEVNEVLHALPGRQFSYFCVGDYFPDETWKQYERNGIPCNTVTVFETSNTPIEQQINVTVDSLQRFMDDHVMEGVQVVITEQARQGLVRDIRYMLGIE